MRARPVGTDTQPSFAYPPTPTARCTPPPLPPTWRHPTTSLCAMASAACTGAGRSPPSYPQRRRCSSNPSPRQSTIRTPSQPATGASLHRSTNLPGRRRPVFGLLHRESQHIVRHVWPQQLARCEPLLEGRQEANHPRRRPRRCGACSRRAAEGHVAVTGTPWGDNRGKKRLPEQRGFAGFEERKSTGRSRLGGRPRCLEGQDAVRTARGARMSIAIPLNYT